MLNISPSSIPTVPHLPPAPRRRRGGQPFNHNALNHGLYAARNRTRLTDIASALPAYSLRMDSSSPDVAQQIILDLMEDICQVYQKLISSENSRAMVACFNTLVRMVSILGRLKLDFKKRFLVGSDLRYVSEHVQALIKNFFWEKGIVSEAHSFRANVDKSDFNCLALQEALCRSVSRSPFPFLTPRQWAVLKPLVPPVERTVNADVRLLTPANCSMPFSGNWPTMPAGRTCRLGILPCTLVVVTTAASFLAVVLTRSTLPYTRIF